MNTEAPAFLNGRDQEAALIAALLKKSEKFDDLDLSLDDFGFVPYGWAYTAIHSLKDNGMNVDQMTVGDELERMGRLDEFKLHDASYSGRLALSKMRDVSSPAGITTYADNVKDYAAKRRLAVLFNIGWQHSNNGRRAADIVSDMLTDLSKFEVSRRENDGTQTTQEVGSKLRQRLNDVRAGKIKFIQTGYRDIDATIQGVEDIELVIIAARPGMGKTAFLACLVDYNLRCGKRVILFELEMAAEQIMMRLIAMRTGIEYDKQKTGNMSADELELWDATLAELENDPNLVINDLSTISVRSMRRAIAKRGKFDMIVIDYLGLAAADERTENRVQEVSKISRGMKQMAKDLKTPVFCAAQLNRQLEQRSDKRPQLSDLKESGSIEQDADIVMFLHRENMTSNETDFIIAKRRNGPVGWCKLSFVSKRAQFRDAIAVQPKV